jgi:hypothetical protein
MHHERDDLRKCTYTLEAEPEHVPIEGNASAVNEEEDAKTNKWVYDQLIEGNAWAWCTVRVTCLLDSGEQGYDTLGCCSYKSLEDFLKDPYWEDMKDMAYRDAIGGE